MSPSQYPLDYPVPEAPADLSDDARQLFEDVVERETGQRYRDGRGPIPPGRVALLVEGLRALDTRNEARRGLREMGLTFTSESGMIRLNPLARVEKDAAGLFARIWKSLDLDWR